MRARARQGLGHPAGSNLCKYLPVVFLHTLLGYDTRSRLFGIGKAVGLKNRSQLYQHAKELFL